MNMPASLIMVQFLAWVAEREHTYAEAMEAWRTSCPRLSVWEDASLDGLVRLEADDQRRTVVRLSPRGRAVLAAATSVNAEAAEETSKINPNRVTQEA